MQATEEVASTATGNVVKCTFSGPCENREKAAELISILRSIQKPKGAYNHDPAEFRKNVIVECIELAEKALKLLGESIPEVKPVCYSHYSDADRIFRNCVGCKYLYGCNPSEPKEAS